MVIKNFFVWGGDAKVTENLLVTVLLRFLQTFPVPPRECSEGSCLKQEKKRIFLRPFVKGFRPEYLGIVWHAANQSRRKL